MYADCRRRHLIGLPAQAYIRHSNADFGNCCLGLSDHHKYRFIALLRRILRNYEADNALACNSYHALSNWGVILLAGAGTFLSIRFADELMDVAHHRDRNFFHRHAFKHEIVIIVFFVFVLIGYYKLIASLGIETKL